MKRLLIQLEEETFRRLRERAFRQERSIASLVRELVARGLAEEAPSKRRTRASQFSSVGAGRSKQGLLAPVSERHDDALAAALGK
jgi:plasmid stability protein